MDARITGQSGLSAFGPIMRSIAGWMRLWRIAIGTRNELAVASPEEVAQIARELGVRPPELADVLAGKPPDGDRLRRVLTALGIDPDALARRNGAVVDHLQHVCVSCRRKEACDRELAAGTAAQNYYRYCPNAHTLDSLYVQATFSGP